MIQSMLINATKKETTWCNEALGIGTVSDKKDERSSLLKHLQNNLGVQGIKDIAFGDTASLAPFFIILTMTRGLISTEIWRALYAATNYKKDSVKLVIAVSTMILTPETLIHFFGLLLIAVIRN